MLSSQEDSKHIQHYSQGFSTEFKPLCQSHSDLKQVRCMWRVHVVTALFQRRRKGPRSSVLEALLKVPGPLGNAFRELTRRGGMSFVAKAFNQIQNLLNWGCFLQNLLYILGWPRTGLEWPQIRHPLSFISRGLGLQACAITPSWNMIGIELYNSICV